MTSWPFDVVRTFSGTIQIVCDLTVQHDVVVETAEVGAVVEDIVALDVVVDCEPAVGLPVP